MNDGGPAGEPGRQDVSALVAERYFLHLAAADVSTVPAGCTPLSTNVIVVLKVCFLAEQPTVATTNFFLFLAPSVVVSDFRPAHVPGTGCWAAAGMSTWRTRPLSVPGATSLSACSSWPSR